MKRPKDQRALLAEIGARIRARRIWLRMTQHELASKVQLTRTSIVNAEAGRQNLVIHKLYLIARALGGTVDGLLKEL